LIKGMYAKVMACSYIPVILFIYQNNIL